MINRVINNRKLWKQIGTDIYTAKKSWEIFKQFGNILHTIFIIIFLTTIISASTSHKELMLNVGHRGVVDKLIVTKDKDIITINETDSIVRIWDSTSLKEKRKILGGIVPNTHIFALALSNDEKYLAIGGYIYATKPKTNIIIIFEYSSGKLVKIIRTNYDLTTDLSFSTDDKYLISASSDNTARIWDVENNFILLDTISFHKNMVTAAKIIKNENKYLAVTVSLDKKIAFYDLMKKEIIHKLDTPIPLRYLAISKEHIATCGDGGEIFIYDYNLNLIKTIDLKPENISKSYIEIPSGLAYSKSGSYLIAGSSSGAFTVKTYSVKDNYKKFRSYGDYDGAVKAVGFLDDNTTVSAGGIKYQINISKQFIKNLSKTPMMIFGGTTSIAGPSNNAITGVGISGDNIAWSSLGHGSASGPSLMDGRSMTIERGSIFSLKYLNMKSPNSGDLFFKFHHKKISNKNNAISLSLRRSGKKNWLEVREDNRRLALIDGTLLSCYGATGSCYGLYKDFIILGGKDGKIYVYDKTGALISILTGHKGKITSLSLDEDRLVSGSVDQTIKIWNLSKISHFDIEQQEFVTETNMASSRKSWIAKKYPDIDINNEDDMKKLYTYFLKEFGVKAAGSLLVTPKIKPLLSLFGSKDDEWIAWTEEGFFTASENGAKYIGYSLNQKEQTEAIWIDIEQLYDYFFRPDLIRLKLEGEDIAQFTSPLEYQDILKNLPPTVSFDTIDNQKISEMKKETSFTFNNKNIPIDKKQIKLTFNINENSGGGVGLIRIYQGGKLIKEIGKSKINKTSANLYTVKKQNILDKSMREKQQKYFTSLSKSVEKKLINDNISKTLTTDNIQNKAGEYTIDVDLSFGNNRFTVEAFNKTNTIVSHRDTVDIRGRYIPEKRKIYAIVLGVNQFESPSVKNLRYSVNDASAMKEALESNTRIMWKGNVEVTYLVNEQVTKNNIQEAVKEISKKANIDDVVFFYISTHGRSVKGNLYLVPFNNKSFKDWISFNEVFQAMQSIKALQQVFIIDACESGTANDIVSNLYDSRATVLARTAGVHMLLATTKGTSAFEGVDNKSKNSVFTQNILNKWKDKKTDLNKDGLITVKELSEKLKEYMGDNGNQHPIIRNVGGDIVIGTYPGATSMFHRSPPKTLSKEPKKETAIPKQKRRSRKYKSRSRRKVEPSLP